MHNLIHMRQHITQVYELQQQYLEFLLLQRLHLFIEQMLRLLSFFVNYHEI